MLPLCVLQTKQSHRFLEKRFKCPYCSVTGLRERDLRKRHIRSQHPNRPVPEKLQFSWQSPAGVGKFRKNDHREQWQRKEDELKREIRSLQRRIKENQAKYHPTVSVNSTASVSAPAPVSVPIVTPTPVSVPVPASAPATVSVPVVIPAPVSVPVPAPAPAPATVSVPVPAPAPVYAPVSVLAPLYEPQVSNKSGSAVNLFPASSPTESLDWAAEEDKIQKYNFADFLKGEIEP